MGGLEVSGVFENVWYGVDGVVLSNLSLSLSLSDPRQFKACNSLRAGIKDGYIE